MQQECKRVHYEALLVFDFPGIFFGCLTGIYPVGRRVVHNLSYQKGTLCRALKVNYHALKIS